MPDPQVPILDRNQLDTQNNNFVPQQGPPPPSGVPFQHLQSAQEDLGKITTDGTGGADYLSDLNNTVMKASGKDDGKLRGGSPILSQGDVKNDRYAQFLPGANNEDIYSEGQGIMSKLANSGANLVAKTVAYTGQALGFLAGAIPAAIGGVYNGVTGNKDGDAISLMTDNFLVKASDSLKQGVEDKFPIYKSNKYTNGSIWDKLGTTSWWLDDAMDRVALTASMFVPGALEAKGIGFAELATRGLEAIAENPENYGMIGRTFLPKLYKAATEGIADEGVNPALSAYARNLSKAELYTWNIMGQSALNAKETQEGIVKSLTDARNGGTNQFTDDEIKAKAATGAMKSFWETVPLSMASSLIEVPQMFSSARNAKSILDKLYSSDSGEALLNNLKSEAPTAGKLALKSALTGFEHGQNESMQVAISRYNEDSASGKDTRGTIPGIWGDFLDNINDPNGQNNIALGTIQGILMTLGGRVTGRKADNQDVQGRTSLFNAINQARMARRYFNGDFTAKDENGKPVVDADGNVELDQSRLADAGLSLAGIQNMTNRKQAAIAAGDYQTVDAINHANLTSFAYNFLDDKNGMDHLTGILKMEAKSQDADASRKNDIGPDGNEITPTAQLNNNLETIKALKRVYDAVDQRHAGFTNLEIDRNDKEQVAKASKFLEDLKWKQYQEASNQLFIGQKLLDLGGEIDDLRSRNRNIPFTASDEITKELNNDPSKWEKKIENPSSPDEEKYNSLIDDAKNIWSEIQDSRDNYKQLVDKGQQRAAFKQQQSFDDDVKEGKFKEQAKAETAEKTIRVKTKDGDEDLEIGKQYYLGNVESDSKEGGSKAKYISFPKFSVVGGNSDGTIKIQSEIGDVRSVPKSVFENHKIGSVSDTENNKKAKFYLQNANTIYEFNFGKGKKQRGRLQYSPKDGVLNFVYKADNGKTRYLEVTGDQFVTKKGFKDPMLKAIGTLTKAQQQSLEDYSKEKDARTDAKRTARLSVIEDLVNETNKRIEKVDGQLKDKREQLGKIKEDLDEVSKKIEAGGMTKKNQFKRTTATAIRSANRLSTLHDQLTDEVSALESQKDELELNQTYFYDLAHNIDELPTDSKEFLEELKEQKNDLESLILSTGEQINTVSKILGNVQKALDTAMNFVRDLINKFEKTYPKAPTSIRNQEYVDFVKANPNFLKLKPNFKDDLKSLEDMVALVEDVDIVPNERTIGELSDKINELNKELRGYEKELGAKQAILDKFENAAKEYKKQQQEIQQLRQSSALLDKVFGKSKDSGSTITQSPEDDQKLQVDNDKWNRWKSASQIASTTAPSGENDYAAQSEDHKRHNVFLNNFDSLPNKDNIRLAIIHQGNEEDIGLKGLVDKALAGFDVEKRDVKNTIVAAYYDIDKGFIDEDGKPVEDKDLNRIVFSTMSSSAIKDSKGNIRYREKEQGAAGIEKIDKWSEWYSKLRAKWLSTSDSIPYQFNISTGIPNRAEGAKNAVTSNLVKASDLNIQGLIQISQNGTLNVNGVSKRFPIGRPVLVKGSTAAFLNNRNFTDKEASLIFDSLKHLSETVLGEKWNPEVVKYLRGIMFIGEPGEKAPGRNQFWVANGKLNIGNQGFNMDFTPASLDENKTKLTEIIKGAYFNVNNNTLQKGEKFNEITGFKNSQPQTRTWRSYQHFLLADRYELDPTLDTAAENGKSRSDVPLSTNLIIPQEGELNAPFKQRYATIIPKENEAYQEPVAKSKEEKLNKYLEEKVNSKGTITVYRGIQPDGEKGTGQFWTTNKSVAQHYAERFGNKGSISEREISLQDATKHFMGFEGKEGVAKGSDIFSLDAPTSQFDGKTKHVALTSKGEKLTFSALVSPDGKKISDIKIDQNEEYAKIEARLKAAGKTDAEIENLLGGTVAKYVKENQQASLESKKTESSQLPGDYIKKRLQEIENTPSLIKVTQDSEENVIQTSGEIIEQIRKELIKIGLPFRDVISNENGSIYYILTKDDEKHEALKILKTGNNLASTNLVKTNWINHLIKTQRQDVIDFFNKQEQGEKGLFDDGISTPESLIKKYVSKGGTADDARATRLVDSLVVQRMTNEDWDEFKSWVKKNIPQVPISRINHVIDMVNGGKAWGTFDKNGITVFESAEKGTQYHEAFEAVWGMFVPDKEQAQIYNEFKRRKGSFIERGTGKTISYSDATLYQAKEEIADEFADYKDDNKEPIKPKDGNSFISKLFKDLVSFLKGLFGGKSAIRDLFKKINTGGFSEAPAIRNSETAQYAAIRGTDEQLTRELMEDVAANIMFTLIPDNKTSAFYNFADNVNSKELYEKVKTLTQQNITNTILGLSKAYDKATGSEKTAIGNAIKHIDNVNSIIENQWHEIVNLNKDYLRSAFKLKVTDQITIDEKENQNKNDYVKNDFFIDSKQNAATAIRLLFNTLVEASKTEKPGEIGIPPVEPNSYGGSKLLRSSKSFIQVMKNLANTNTLKEMMKKVFNLAQKNPDYVRLYTRLKGSLTEPGELNYDNMSFNDWRLLFDFNNTFSKQAPIPHIIFTNESGETYFQQADLNNLVNNQVNQWVSSLRSIAKKGNEFIKKGKVGRLTSYNIKVNSPTTFAGDPEEILRKKLIPMLSKLGVDINPALLKKMPLLDITSLKSAAENYLKYINVKDATFLDKNKIGVTGPLSSMAAIVLKNSDLELKSTYFNVENEQQQLYINDNYFSKLANTINTIQSLDELKSKYPEYNDVFATNSLILRAGGEYFDTDGRRTGKTLDVGYLNGLQLPNRVKTVDKFTESERLLSSINGILKGWYNIIMPSDASTEWMMKLGSFFNYSDFSSDAASKKVRSIFGGYLKDEMGLILAQPNRVENLYRDRNSNTLRFMNGIVTEGMRAKITQFLKEKPNQQDISSFVDSNMDAIEKSVNTFLKEEVENVKSLLKRQGKLSTKIQEVGDKMVDKVVLRGFDTDFSRSNGFTNMTENGEGDTITSEFTPEELDRVLTSVVANYAIGNVEMHKLIFGDPNAFKSSKDELKRIKSFGSPRGSIYSGDEANRFLNENKNKAGNIQLSPEDPGYTNFDDVVNTYTLADFMVVGAPAVTEGNNEYDEVDRSDAQMWAMPSFYREVQMKSSGSAWSDDAEKLYQYDAAAFRQYYAGKNKTYGEVYNANKKLKNYDDKLLERSLPESFKANILKPIITGHKSGVDYIDTMLDKQSAFPVFFSFTQEGSHLRDLYVKNFEAGMDYAIVLTGRKEGAQALHNFYTPDGKVNKSPIEDESKFQFPITNFGIQQETGYQGDKGSVRGTQATKEITINRFTGGVPNDTKMNWEDWNKLTEAQKQKESSLYKDIRHNDSLLDELTNHGYDQLLRKLSIRDTGLNYEVGDPKKLEETLLDEVLRGQSNDNVLDSVRVNKETGDFNISFEASNNYQKIKNILLSIVDKNVVSPKINGGPKIQLSSALWDTDKTLQPYLKGKDGWKQVENFDSLSEKEKGKVRLFSTKLKFYRKGEDGNTLHCQVLLPHWFADKIKATGRFANDEEIMQHLNSTKEGKDILRGIGFRIPTQEMNSIEAFEVAGFLPQAAGDTIVVPAEITKKAGSDFDVDKLNTYLKNIYVSADGSIKLIPFFGFGEEAKQALKEKVIASRILSVKDVKANANAIENLSQADLEDKDDLRDDLETIYKQSLQNEYIASFEKLLLSPDNYDRLIKPNSNNGMEKLRDDLNDKLGSDEVSGGVSKSPLLSMSYINSQRQNSIVGKYSVGIGALSQVHHALSQRAPVYIDPERIAKAVPQDKKFLGDGDILLNHNEVEVGGKKFPSISNILDTVGQYISDKISAYMNGFVDISKDTFIVELGATPQLAGTFLFLERIGVPTKTVVYFMNQPIVREYLKDITANGTTFLFNAQAIENTMYNFDTPEKATKINEKSLGSNIEKYYKDGKKFTSQENAEQQLILSEFLKYAKMAEHLRKYTQAVTWDTSNFSDFSLLAMKNILYRSVKENNIFTSPDQILDRTFLGNMKNKIQQSSEAMSAFLKLQSPRVQSTIMKVLEPLIDPNENYQSPKDVIKIGNKVTSSFIDYITQTRFTAYQSPLNENITRLLIGDENTAEKLRKVKGDEKDPLNENYALQRLGYLIGNQEGEVNNITNQLKDNDSFSQNQFISALRELKGANKDIYNRLVLTSLLQSGGYKSFISYTDLIPIEDYAAVLNPIINGLEDGEDFSTFASKNLFLRNNWQDRDLVPVIQENAKSRKGTFYNQVRIGKDRYPAATQKLINSGVKGNSLPVAISPYLTNGANIITIRRNDTDSFKESEIKAMKAKGNFSYKITIGYERVVDPGGEPLIISNVDESTGKVYEKVVYKPINLYGDGIYAQEYYNDTRPSVIDNGTLKLKNELENSKIFDAFGAKEQYENALTALNLKPGKC